MTLDNGRLIGVGILLGELTIYHFVGKCHNHDTDTDTLGLSCRKGYRLP